MLLENGNPVFGVEPNTEMRQAGERLLAAFPKFTSVAGTAEATTLPDQSVDFVTAAQAAHWFDREHARREFVRILKPGGWLVLLWNERLTDSTPFLRDYEQLLLTYGTDYQDVRHERTTDAINRILRSRAVSGAGLRHAAGIRLRGHRGPAAVVVVCARAGTSELRADAARTAAHFRRARRRRTRGVRIQNACVLWTIEVTGMEKFGDPWRIT